MGSDKNQYAAAEPGLDLPSYVRLRTILDSLELGAIKYMLKEPEGRGGRYDELTNKLQPIVDWVWKKVGGDAMVIDCPEGYIDCHGACVPYPCPDSNLDQM
jgi:hypothetical protein